MSKNAQIEEVLLSEVAKLYPTVDAAQARLIELRASLALPMPTVHVISDIHGEFKKLKHVINNASGGVRPLVEKLFGSRLSEPQQQCLLSFLYYPRESFSHYALPVGEVEARHTQLLEVLTWEAEIIHALARRGPLREAERVFPEPYEGVFRELVFAPDVAGFHSLLEILLGEFARQSKEVELMRLFARTVRNLLVAELVVAGDLGDRGPRVDKVIDYLMHQPNVSITWGNHDASWLGACLGDLACIATVLRISLRYRRLSQLEEGFGITMAPLEKLARTVYEEDPAERFLCKGDGLRETSLMSRMQKAVAIIQFKLEGQTIRRNPHFSLEHRNLLHRISSDRRSVTLEGRTYDLLDSNLPTLDSADPYVLSPEEHACMDRIRQSFLESQVLWEQMQFMVRRGSMYLRRDNALIFHACVPVDDQGEFLPFEVNGSSFCGRALFDEIGKVVCRVLRTPTQPDLDLLWYLWSGPRSPWFGKDKMTTFEGYFLAEKETHEEIKNPYFKLLHDKEFCRKVLREFGMNADEGLIVNGHVPVKVEKGEDPVKKSGMAVTIDGAFSEAYGDRGFTLVLDSEQISLAQHHHFDSVADAIGEGADIIPSIKTIRRYPARRCIADTEQGVRLRAQIVVMERLISALQGHSISA